MTDIQALLKKMRDFSGEARKRFETAKSSMSQAAFKVKCRSQAARITNIIRRDKYALVELVHETGPSPKELMLAVYGDAHELAVHMHVAYEVPRVVSASEKVEGVSFGYIHPLM